MLALILLFLVVAGKEVEVDAVVGLGRFHHQLMMSYFWLVICCSTKPLLRHQRHPQ
jgi:hypothetical protein